MKKSKVEMIEKHGKIYIDGEEVLYAYRCIGFVQNSVVMVGSVFVMILSYISILERGTSTIQTLGFLVIELSFLIVFYRAIQNLLHQGFYVTSEELITFSGKKINLDRIEYKFITAPQFLSSKIIFYGEEKYLLSCSIDEDNEEYKNFLDVLSEVSGNLQFKSEYTKSYFIKTKLVKGK